VKPWLDDGDVRIWHGDALEQLAAMPDASVQCIVTSPPFWGLRDYGTGSWVGGAADCDHLGEPFRTKASINANCGTGQDVKNAADRQPFKSACGKCGARRVDQQIGLEETPDEWCQRLVAVFREARRVLRDDGVLWLEVGDTYCSTAPGTRNVLDEKVGTGASQRAVMRAETPAGMKPKDLVGAPWLLAFALRADGWYLRSDTIWARPNPMPESVTDRPTKSHSYVFLLTKSARYMYDADAIRDPQSELTVAMYGHRENGAQERTGLTDDAREAAMAKTARPSAEGRWQNVQPDGRRNARSVWQIATEPTPFAHFATFPQALVERCILAGTSERGACSVCGAPWRRVTERATVGAQATNNAREDDPHGGRHDRTGFAGQAVPHVTTVGWEASCPHVDAPVKPCVVLDPFMGSGTTALVARRLGRHAVGVELNVEYLAIAATRLQQLSLLGGAA
jgi:DNA modification methylase